MRTLLHIITLCLLPALLLAGCGGEKTRKWDPASVSLDKGYHPLGDVTRVAVVPFTANSNVEIRDIPFDYSNAFCNELVRYNVPQVVRPDYVWRFMRANNMSIRTSEDIVELGKRLDADLIIVAQLTDYFPYNPPRIAVNLQVFSTRVNPAMRNTELEQWMTAGVPYALEVEGQPTSPVVAVETLYDAGHTETYEKLKEYATVHRNKETSYTKFQGSLKRKLTGDTVDDYIHVMPKYFSFVSDQLIQEMLSRKAEWDLLRKRRDEQRRMEAQHEMRESSLE